MELNVYYKLYCTNCMPFQKFQFKVCWSQGYYAEYVGPVFAFQFRVPLKLVIVKAFCHPFSLVRRGIWLGNQIY